MIRSGTGRKIRNRIENRKVEVYEDMLITDTCKWKNIKAIVKVERQREVFDTKKKQWETTGEISYYVSSKVLVQKTSARESEGTGK